MSFPGRPPRVPYGLATGVVTVPKGSHVMVGAGGRTALLPAPAQGKADTSRAPTTNGDSQPDSPRVHVFIGNISAKAPDAMTRALLAACGPVISWKRAGTFGFCEFGGVEAALRCVRLLHDRSVADRRLVARVDGKMQALVDTYKSEERSRLSADDRAPGTDGGGGGAGEEGGYLDARGRAIDDAVERKLAQILHDYQHEINNYETLQKEEAISKTAKVLEEADFAEEKRDVIHREIDKFRESMKGEVVFPPKRDKDDKQRDRERDRDRDRDKARAGLRERDKKRGGSRERDKDRRRRNGSRMECQDVNEVTKAGRDASSVPPAPPAAERGGARVEALVEDRQRPFVPTVQSGGARVEALVEDRPWSGVEPAARAGNALEGSAFIPFQSREPSRATWQNLRTDLIDSFPEQTLSEKLSDAISYSSDSADSYAEYAREKLRLLRRTEVGFSEEQLVRLVCDTVSNDDVRATVCNGRVTTTAALIVLLSTYVKAKKRHVESNNKDSTGNSGPSGTKQFRVADEKKCMFCDQYGHYSIHCPRNVADHPPQAAATRPLRPPPQPPKLTNLENCDYCQRFGYTECTCFDNY